MILRGINTGGVASTVAIYVDEIPFGSSGGLVNGGVLAGDFDTFDVARVEVLQGPQGTLYGSNALGGVIKFVTAEPELGRFESRGQASAWNSRRTEVPAGLAMRWSTFRLATRSRSALGILPRSTRLHRLRSGRSANDINDSRAMAGAFRCWSSRGQSAIRLTALAQNIRADLLVLRCRSGELRSGERHHRRGERRLDPIFDHQEQQDVDYRRLFRHSEL